MRVYNIDKVKIGNSVIVTDNIGVSGNGGCPSGRYIVGRIKSDSNSPKLIALERKDGKTFSNGNRYYYLDFRNRRVMVFD